ncbi:MAG TPA: phage virion morphogenesis protein [Ktedonobacterales bacterium]|nr:phage virion morphogenesis protein [Ktedonobacterales bacterium]
MAGQGAFIPITITVDGVEIVSRRLATWGARIDDLSLAWEQIGEDLLADFRQNFDYEGDLLDKQDDGWAALADATVLDRTRRGFGGEHPILVRAGDLQASVTARGAPGNVFDVRADSLSVGSEDARAGYHQWGTSRMPARPIVGISWARRSGIVDRLNTYIQAQARQQGLMP